VTDRCEKLGIEAAQSSQRFSIDLAGLVVGSIDQSDFASVRYDHLVTAFLEQTAHPGGVRTHLNHNDHRCSTAKVPAQRSLGRTQSTVIDNGSILVKDAEFTVAVAKIDSNCYSCGNLLSGI